MYTGLRGSNWPTSLAPPMSTAILSDATIAQDDRTTRNFFLAGIVLLCYDYLLTLVGRFSTFGSRAQTKLPMLRPAERCPRAVDRRTAATRRIVHPRDYRTHRRRRSRLACCSSRAHPNFDHDGPRMPQQSPPDPNIRRGLGSTTRRGRPAVGVYPISRLYAERNEIFRYETLWRIIVRDGAMYFGIICLSNLANILMYYFGDQLSAFAVSLSVTMICRLMLNLHDAAAINPEISVFVVTHTMELETLEMAEPPDRHRTVHLERDLGEC
ncbi:hypothetical protein B0H17DRAFT_193542 [Mycena rosella]|uniref:Uncharacterized protein n=1 Tax=Mycena rosella TaxID=1033263 RepID=A0AAD7G690_MYCRO|nr:hypothetical protein B0H17DRAFT_193542 [Mycena rosella]